MKYTLTSDEQYIVNNLIDAIEEDEKVSTYFRRNPVDTKQTKKEAQKQSFGAEIAYCQLFNLKYNMNLNKECSLVDTTFNGYKIDIKQTKYPTGKLIVKEQDAIDSPIDVYVLMVGEFPTYECKGYAYKNEIIQEKNIKNLGYKNSNPYCLEQYQLHKGIIK